MMKLARLLSPWLFLAACQSGPPPHIPAEPQPQSQTQFQSWSEYMVQINALDSQQLLLARESALRQYTALPNDWVRLRTGYVLSRTPASPQQLVQSREILAGIPAASELAPVRDLVDGEIRMFTQRQEAESRMQEADSRARALQTQVDELQNQIVVLETQLTALKAIEADMVESQRQADETHP